MAVAPIGATPPLAAPPPVQTAKAETESGSFADAIMRSLDSVSQAEFRADGLTQALAAGEDLQLHEVTIAATEATLSLELLAAVRDRAVAAYDTIMNMQV